jgi:hypothetical protein
MLRCAGGRCNRRLLDGPPQSLYIIRADSLPKEIAMQRFASRDLMVTALPLDEEWAQGGCADCTNCTDNTKEEKPPTTKTVRDTELAALRAQLSAARREE